MPSSMITAGSTLLQSAGSGYNRAMNFGWAAALLGLLSVACSVGSAIPSDPPAEPPGPAAETTQTSAPAPPVSSPTALPSSTALPPYPTWPPSGPTPVASPLAVLSPSPSPQPTWVPSPGPRPTSAAGFRIEPAFPGLDLDGMVAMAEPDDGTGRLFVVLQPGRIVTFPNDPGASSAGVFLDISPKVNDRGNEEGLLGMAFDPDFRENGYFYVYYTVSESGDSLLSRLTDAVLSVLPVVDSGGSRWSVASRFSVSPINAAVADPDSELIFMVVPQPYSNHNGGNLVFGPDGYLYIGLGDGGGGGDPQENAQDPSNLLGTLLRIDVSSIDATGAYAIPPDNPFAGEEGARPEIWAYGLRNPWRFSFDRVTDDLWAADVGQNQYEEIDLVLPGRNYGWNVMEGDHCFKPSLNCDRTGLEAPIAEYDHSDGCSVTGGYVYRGTAVPSLYGAYIFADFCSGRMWALRYDGQGEAGQTQISGFPTFITSFAEDLSGELYALSRDGKIYKFVP